MTAVHKFVATAGNVYIRGAEILPEPLTDGDKKTIENITEPAWFRG